MEVDELAKLDVVSKTVGSLSLVRDVVARRGFADSIDTHCPLAAQAELSCGTVAELLVANRLQAPKPLYKVAHGAREVGVEDVFGIPPELLNDDRLGRMVELLGQPGPMLKGESALHTATTFQIGLEPLHWELTPVDLEGAQEEEKDTAPPEREGRHIPSAKEGQGRAKKALTVGLHVANDEHGPLPISYEPLDGNASGDQVTWANITPLKQQLKLDRIMRINERGCQRATILAHSLAHGCDTMAPITWKNPLEPLVRAALAAGTALPPRAYGPVSQQPRDPAQRAGQSAFESPDQVGDKHRVYPVRLLVVKSEGQVKRRQKGRQRHRAWIEAPLKQLPARVGQPRWTKKRIHNNLRKALKPYPEGQWSNVILVGFGKHAQALRVAVNEAKRPAAPPWDGMYALVPTLPAEAYATDRGCGLCKEHHEVERSNHILKGQLRIRPVSLKKPIRLEGLLFMLGLALVT